MSLTSKIMAIAGTALGAVTITLAFFLWYCYGQVQELSAGNAELTKSVESVSIALHAEIERNKNVALWTAELMRREDERQEEMLGFNRKLAELKKSDKEVRALLSAHVPRNALAGLRSFASRNIGAGNGTRPGAPDRTDDVSR